MMQHAAVSISVFSRLANAAWALSQHHWRLVVVAMLALLHVAVVRGVADPWARALLLAHLGLLLLWQPFVRAEQRISPAQGLLLLLGAFLLMLRLAWCIVAFRMVVLWVVILGIFTLMTLGRTGYIEALASTVTLVGGAVLLIALAWNPRSGFAGLNVFFSRYLFSIGLPMEKWLHFLAELSQLEA